MSEPLIVISTFSVREGKLEDLERYYKKILEIVKANKPQLIAFHGFLNKDRTEMTCLARQRPRSRSLRRSRASTAAAPAGSAEEPVADPDLDLGEP